MVGLHLKLYSYEYVDLQTEYVHMLSYLTQGLIAIATALNASFPASSDLEYIALSLTLVWVLHNSKILEFIFTRKYAQLLNSATKQLQYD